MSILILIRNIGIIFSYLELLNPDRDASIEERYGDHGAVGEGLSKRQPVAGRLRQQNPQAQHRESAQK
jgi:hypothetical protein